MLRAGFFVTFVTDNNGKYAKTTCKNTGKRDKFAVQPFFLLCMCLENSFNSKDEWFSKHMIAFPLDFNGMFFFHFYTTKLVKFFSQDVC